MKTTVNRRTVDLMGFPDLVVIYLGMRVNALVGLKTVIGFGPKIAKPGRVRIAHLNECQIGNILILMALCCWASAEFAD